MKSGDTVHIFQPLCRPYITDQHLVPFYRVLCKIANLLGIDLKFSDLISDVTIDNPANLVDLPCPKAAFLDNSLLVRFVNPLIYRPDQFFCQFRTSLLGLTFGKNFMVIRPVGFRCRNFIRYTLINGKIARLSPCAVFNCMTEDLDQGINWRQSSNLKQIAPAHCTVNAVEELTYQSIITTNYFFSVNRFPINFLFWEKLGIQSVNVILSNINLIINSPHYQSRSNR